MSGEAPWAPHRSPQRWVVGFATALAVAMVLAVMPVSSVSSVGAQAPALISVTVDGQGSGHGRGLSAWGAYGSAVNLGWSWRQILDHYFGGTLEGSRSNETIGVRLAALDGSAVTAVLSTRGQAVWNGTAYGSVHAWEAAPNQYDLWGSATAGCPGSPTGTWAYLGRVAGPVRVTTPFGPTAPAGDVLGVCRPDGTVVHYRGSVEAVNDSAGNNRTVNVVAVEQYLRGVVSREVSTSWGNAGGGKGMNSLWAMAVTARSFALSQSRYTYARTCDSASCQVYGGAAHRASATAPVSPPRVQVCEGGNPTFECANTDAAVAQTAGVVRVWPDGRIVSTEYSASHGPRSAGGSFPPVDDTASNVPQNPNYRWSRTLDAAAIAARYGLGQLVAASTERDPGSPYDANWGNRVRLVGTAGQVVVSNWDFRNAFGLPSPGFAITATAAPPTPPPRLPSLPCYHKGC